MISKYLSDLEIKEDQLPWNWCPNDKEKRLGRKKDTWI